MFVGAFIHLCLKPKEGKQPNVGKSEMGVTSHCDPKKPVWEAQHGRQGGEVEEEEEIRENFHFWMFYIFLLNDLLSV